MFVLNSIKDILIVLYLICRLKPDAKIDNEKHWNYLYGIHMQKKALQIMKKDNYKYFTLILRTGSESLKLYE